MSQPTVPADPVVRPHTIQSPVVAELLRQLEEARAVIDNLRYELNAERDAYALLSDANADLAKENRGLRAELAAAQQDVNDARHDADECLRELNRRDDDTPLGSDFVG